jgi:hypothetical protein
MKSAILRLTLMGALALGGGSFGVTAANAACFGIGGAWVCAPVAKHKHWRRHHGGIVLEFGRSYQPRYYKKRYFRRHVNRDFYHGGYRDRPYRRNFGRYDPYWHGGWGDPADHWR